MTNFPEPNVDLVAQAGVEEVPDTYYLNVPGRAAGDRFRTEIVARTTRSEREVKERL